MAGRPGKAGFPGSPLSKSPESTAPSRSPRYRVSPTARTPPRKALCDRVHAGDQGVLGLRCMVRGGHGPASVRFVGHTQFAPGMWVGVELDEQTGRHDGAVDGIAYFTCRAHHGLFVRAEKLHPVKQPARARYPLCDFQQTEQYKSSRVEWPLSSTCPSPTRDATHSESTTEAGPADDGPPYPAHRGERGDSAGASPGQSGGSHESSCASPSSTVRSCASPSSTVRSCASPSSTVRSCADVDASPWRLNPRTSGEWIDPVHLQVGMHATHKGRPVVVRYIGPVMGKDAIAWAGVEYMDEGAGATDGSLRGVRYFLCSRLGSVGDIVPVETLKHP